MIVNNVIVWRKRNGKNSKKLGSVFKMFRRKSRKNERRNKCVNRVDERIK